VKLVDVLKKAMAQDGLSEAQIEKVMDSVRIELAGREHTLDSDPLLNMEVTVPDGELDLSSVIKLKNLLAPVLEEFNAEIDREYNKRN